MIKLAKNATREVLEYALSCYACYLIVQNGESTKPVIAHGQTYLAIKTRRQELKEHNKMLVETAQKAGVETTVHSITIST
ncbi:MAG: hypothetical protein OCD01_13615 [Fibrobacterales bacterium]